MRPEAQRALKRNAGYVHDILINFDNIVVYRNIFTRKKFVGSTHAYTTICTSLQKLSIVSCRPMSEDLPNPEDDNLLGLFEQNPRLQELTLDVLEIDVTTFSRVVAHTGRLRRLSIEMCCQPGLRALSSDPSARVH